MELNRSIVVFNHNVDKAELMEVLTDDFCGDIVVYGNLYYDHGSQRESDCVLDIFGNLYVEGNIDMEDAFLKLHGDLVCRGYIVARELTANSVDCTYELCVRRRLIADDVFCDTLNAYIVNVNGDVVCNNSQIDTMNVFGNYICFKKTRVEGATVNGNCICEGDIYSICLKVFQNLMCDGYVNSYIVNVDGNVNVMHEIFSAELKVGGKLETSTIG